MGIAAKATARKEQRPGYRRSWWSDHRPQAAVIALGVLFVVVVWAGLLFYIQERDRAAFAQAEKDVASLALTLEEQVERTILGIDQVMRFAQAAFEEDPQGFDLHSWVDKAPFLRSLSLQIAMADAAGDVVVSNLPTAPGTRANIADRDHFRVHVEQPQAGLYVSRPVLGRVSKRWSIQLSRRLNTPTGDFAGVLVVSLDPDYLAGLFDTMDPGPGGSITLFGRDGFVRARTPTSEGMFDHGIGAELRQMETCKPTGRPAAGVCRARSPVDGVDRIFGFRELNELPLIVSVGRSARALTAQLHEARRRELGLAALLTFALVAALFFLVRQLERRVQREAELRESQAKLRQNSASLAATLDNIDQGLMMVDPEGRIQVCNRRAMELLDLPQSLIDARANFAEITQFQLDRGEFGDAGELSPQWDPLQLAPGAAYVYERQRPDGRILEIRTVRLPDNSAVRTYSDVTARRKAEIAVRESEERYRTIAEHLPQKVWMIKPDGTAVYHNQAMMAYHGAIGLTAEDRMGLFHPDDAPGSSSCGSAASRAEPPSRSRCASGATTAPIAGIT